MYGKTLNKAILNKMVGGGKGVTQVIKMTLTKDQALPNLKG